MQRSFEALERHGMAVLVGALAVTAALVVPLLFFEPEATASQNPPGEVFDTQELVDERFRSSVFEPPFVVEARSGDILLRDPLWELLRNEDALRASETGSYLVSRYDPDTGRVLPGLVTLADAVHAILLANGVGGLEFATDDQVKIAVSLLLEEGKPTAGLRDMLSADRRSERREVGTQQVEIDYWVASALVFHMYADNDALGGGPTTIEIGSDDTTLEEYARDAQVLLRGDEEFIRAWGIAIDVNLTSREEGETAAPYIALTIVAVLLVVGWLLRSYWAVALVGAGLAGLMIWLKGIANLVGLERSLTLDLIVPIAMVSFGVDFAFHALGRYREERGDAAPGRAFALGLSAVVAALVLALLSDVVAFLANVSSGIPSVIQFGIGATIALAAAFVVLGVLVPLAASRVDAALVARGASAPRRAVRLGGMVLAALFAGAAVLAVIVLPGIGVALVGVYLVLFVALPAWALWRRPAEAADGKASEGRVEATVVPAWVTAAVVRLARGRRVFLPGVLLVTVAAAVFAVRVEAEFDVKDFFSSDGDLAVSLDKLDEHRADLGGEPAIFYIEADAGNPAVVAAIDEEFGRLDAMGSTLVARDSAGRLVHTDTPAALSRDALASEAARSAIEERTGVGLSDGDGDGIVDTREELVALFAAGSTEGIALDGEVTRHSANDVRQVVWLDGAGQPSAARVAIELPGTRSLEVVEAVRDELTPFVEGFETRLREVDPDASVALTGGPFTREASLDATYRSLQRSFPIAVVLCFALVAVFMRSVRFALASIVPILLVVVWLYAFMYLAGFTLNPVTATIAAVSIGVGIDYAIHFTMRFREELAAHTPVEAVERTVSSTGGALAGSALSSVVGFCVMAFAPMPLFASYGVLTAVMILVAAIAAVVVLPPLLVLVAPREVARRLVAGRAET